MSGRYVADIGTDYCPRADHWAHSGPCPTYDRCPCVVDGPAWEGRCYRCHLELLLPPESFADECVGIGRD